MSAGRSTVDDYTEGVRGHVTVTYGQQGHIDREVGSPVAGELRILGGPGHATRLAPSGL
jgi:hypothetical protein